MPAVAHSCFTFQGHAPVSLTAAAFAPHLVWLLRHHVLENCNRVCIIESGDDIFEHGKELWLRCRASIEVDKPDLDPILLRCLGQLRR